MADVIANVVDVITTILQLESITIVADVIATYSWIDWLMLLPMWLMLLPLVCWLMILP